MADPRIIELRRQLRRKFPAAHARAGHGSPVSSPAPSAEAASAIHGGVGGAGTPPISAGLPEFPPGALSEVVAAAPACGISLILAGMLGKPPHPLANAPDASAFGARSPAPLVLIDARDRFDPDSFPPDQCARLLWVRCRETTQALEAADLLVRDGNLPRIVLDLAALPPRELRRIRRPVWYRFRQLAAGRGTALIVLSPAPTVPCAALRITLTSRFTLDDLAPDRIRALRRLRATIGILRRVSGS